MKIYCETLGYWLYHPVNASLICDNRALKYSECRRCRGIESPKTKAVQKESLPKLIPINVDQEKWGKVVRELRGEYNIREGTKQDETSSRRIAILLGEAYIINFRDTSDVVKYVPIVEKDCFDLAMEWRLSCHPLDRESRVKPHLRKQVLCTWGVDKTSGVEGYTSQLKEWTKKALLENPEELEEESYGADGREIDFRGRPLESTGFEEIGIGPS